MISVNVKANVKQQEIKELVAVSHNEAENVFRLRMKQIVTRISDL